MVTINTRFAPPVMRPQEAIQTKKNVSRSAQQQGIKQHGVRQQIARQEQGAVTRAAGQDIGQEDLSPAAQLQSFTEASDNASMMMAQFRSARDLKKSADTGSDQFERVLDEDAHPKAREILKVAALQNTSAEDLLRQARALFPDISDLIIVLRELLRRRQLEEIVRIRLQQALTQAEEEAPPKTLKAGINIALKARLFGAKLALSASLLRASYRRFLESDDAEIMIYEEWIAGYGCERRVLIMEFLESALVADMLAQDPSCSRIEFGNLLGKLNQLKLLRSSEALFIDSMLGDPLVRAHNDREADWLMFMLGLMQAPGELDELLMAAIGDAIYISSHARRSRLLQTIRHACEALPRNLFLEPEAGEMLRQRFGELAAISLRGEMMELRGGVRPDDPFEDVLEGNDGNDGDDDNDGADPAHRNTGEEP